MTVMKNKLTHPVVSENTLERVPECLSACAFEIEKIITITTTMAEQTPSASEQTPSWSSTYLFLSFLLIDFILTISLTTPLLFPNLQEKDSTTLPWPWSSNNDTTSHYYKLYSSLFDLTILSVFRILSALFAIILAYYEKQPPSPPFELYHPNGEKKSMEEIEEETVDENFIPWITRYISRHCMLCEIISLITMLLLVLKFLARLNVEIGVYDDKVKHHPMWWSTLIVISILTFVESYYIENVMIVTGECTRYYRSRQSSSSSSVNNNTERRRITLESNDIIDALATPLLIRHQQHEQPQYEDENNNNNDVEEPDITNNVLDKEIENEEELVGISDISGDATYKASFVDLLKLCLPDAPLFFIAFAFLIVSAYHLFSYIFVLMNIIF